MQNERVLNYLIPDFTVSVRDPLWGDILLTKQMFSLLSHPVVFKLSRIKQLGPAYIAYPGAVHTRLGHSLGVYDVSRRILIALAKNGCSFTKTGIMSFLVSALLHDLGHFPYAHSLKDVLSRTHESLACDIITSDKSLSDIIEACGANTGTVCRIISPVYNIEYSISDTEINFYQKLLSGTLDPDKLDYLCRDAFYCGVPYGVQDVSYITDHIVNIDGKPSFSGNTGSIEHILFSKYLMYKNVYWHSTVRSATAMVKKAVRCALADKVISEEELYFLDDQQFFDLCSLKKYPPLTLVSLVRDGNVYKTFDTVKDTSEIADLENKYIMNNNIESWQVITDIPEPISFEADITVISDKEQKAKFASEVIVPDSFASSLRNIRVFHP